MFFQLLQFLTNTFYVVDLQLSPFYQDEFGISILHNILKLSRIDAHILKVKLLEPIWLQKTATCYKSLIKISNWLKLNKLKMWTLPERKKKLNVASKNTWLISLKTSRLAIHNGVIWRDFVHCISKFKASAYQSTSSQLRLTCSNGVLVFLLLTLNIFPTFF